VVDVGTNSVKLLVAEVRGAVVTPLYERSEQTRLGRGFYEDHRLRPDAIQHTAGATARFVARAREMRAERTRVIATSAARDAVNRDELLAALNAATGLPVEVISGEVEAAMAFRGVCSDARLAGHPLLVMDLGGGSTEFIVGCDGVISFSRSYPLGTVRLFERLRPGDQPGRELLARCRAELAGFLAQTVGPDLGPALAAAGREGMQFVAVGGTAAILARIELGLSRYDRRAIEAAALSLATVAYANERLWDMSLAERKHVSGLPAERADIILTGVAVFEAVMRAFRLAAVRPSLRGLRFAAVMDEA
jgi:exopolyphosphatase/guanosine-5'-triphosphate,3'-diphosphate pyrophosphatase